MTEQPLPPVSNPEAVTNADAQNNLGWRYEKGQGVPQDYKKAVKWYRLAADQGDTYAQCNLAAMYSRGQGVARDHKKAFKWYRRAAEQGHALGQVCLGVVYENGQGVTKSRVAAYALYNISAANDPSENYRAGAYRNKLVKKMSRKKLEAGQALTRKMLKSDNLLAELAKYVKE